MYLDHIEIYKLLGFRRLSVDIDEHLQIIAGPNNSGKSSLVRLIEIFFSDPSPSDILKIMPLNSYYTSGGPRMLSTIRIHFGGLSSAESEGMEDLMSSEGTFWVQISCTRKGKISYRTYEGDTPRSRKIYEWVLQSFNFVKIPSVRVSGDEQLEDQSFARLHETLEGVLVRSGSSRATQLQKEFADAITPVEELVRNVLNESVAAVANELPFQEPNLGVDLPDTRYALRGILRETVITSHDEVKVPIAERGTGFQSAMVLGILRYVSSRSRQNGAYLFFAVEEPEAFLHPQTQRAMAKILRDISDEAQLLVTTHSPVLVDSYSVAQIARLPLDPEGVTFNAQNQNLSDAEEGRLTRYCDATNSELVFASAVILVEGHGDKLLIDFMLERITGGPGGHYALGITVIEASGISTISHLLRLAHLFSVRAYVITDKDGVHKNGDGKRALLEILKLREVAPSQQELNSIRDLADVRVVNLKSALDQQEKINSELALWDAFVLSSDLEGLLLDSIKQEKLAEMLGPGEADEVGQPEVERFSTGQNGREAMASWLGSKGWNSDRKKTGKAKPHLPSALLRLHLTSGASIGRGVRPLHDWLSRIVEEHQKQY